jgi:hypothetical protein
VYVLQIVFFVVHWAACVFYYIAKQHGFGESSWVGKSGIDGFEGKHSVEK